MNTADYIARLTPEQREKLPTEWFDRDWKCTKCGEHVASENVTFDERHDSECYGVCIAGGPPDITDPANLTALLTVCDAMNGFPVAMFWNRKDKHGCAFALFSDGPCVGRGSTRTEAALNALDKALGVKP